MVTTDEYVGPVDDPVELPMVGWVAHLWAFFTLR